MSNSANCQSANSDFNPWRGLVKVLTEPTQCFRCLVQRQAILPPFLIHMAAPTVVLIMLPRSIASVKEHVAAIGAPPEVVDLGMWADIIGSIFSILITPWTSALFVALLAMVFGFFQSGGVRYSAYLSLVGYARIPLALGVLLEGATMTLATILGAENYIGMNLAAFASENTNPYITAVLTTLNPFEIWYFVLLSIGVGTLHKGKVTTGVILSLVLYTAGLLFKLASTAIWS